jgi:hypothetical protein
MDSSEGELNLQQPDGEGLSPPAEYHEMVSLGGQSLIKQGVYAGPLMKLLTMSLIKHTVLTRSGSRDLMVPAFSSIMRRRGCKT